MHNTIKERLKVITIGLLLFFPCIIMRLFYLQVIAQSYYEQESTRNLERYRSITPNRGAIRDCKNKLLVKTAPAYNILIHLEKLTKDSQEKLAKLLSVPPAEVAEKIEKCRQQCNDKISRKLAREFGIPIEEYRKLLQKIGDDHKKMATILASVYGASKKRYRKLYRRFKRDYYNRPFPLYKDVPKKIALELDLGKSSWVKKNYKNAGLEDEFPGVEVGSTISRRYPGGDTMVHILGRIGSISREEYESKEKDYKIIDVVGKQGLEKIYENRLRGRRGCMVNSRQGQEFNWMENSMDGMDLILTIDAKAQRVAEKSLDAMIEKTPGATGGAAVLIEVNSGEIKILATSPRYDNATYSKNYKRMSKDPRRPLENRAIRNSYPSPPGSVFKIMVALYALQYGFADEEEKIYCRGYLRRRGSFRCTHVHGPVSMIEAIEGSCNVYFYTLGERMGPERLVDCARLFGFGEKCKLGFAEEQAGLLPTPEWKMRTLGEDWYPGDSRMFGIGQRLEVTPIQVAQAMAMVATRGIMPRVHLVKNSRMSDLPQPLQPAGDSEVSLVAFHKPVKSWRTLDRYWDIVYEGMRLVVEGRPHLATAWRLREKLDVTIAAKTGTAEVGKHKNEHAWFAGFFPFDNPMYAFAVFVEHGGYGGKTAGPIAVDIINHICRNE